MAPGLRKLVLTTHIVASVGWLGAVACFLALAFAGLTRQEPELVRAAYLAAELTTWWVIVPLCLTSLLTGIIQALGTTWGLFRHYWVLTKLVLTLLATALLLLHTQPIAYLAEAAARTALASTELRDLRVRLTGDAGAALLVLVLATVLSVFKPSGLTRYGWRQKHAPRD
jgi:hypothetical protein